jgi:hypothetical protein
VFGSRPRAAAALLEVMRPRRRRFCSGVSMLALYQGGMTISLIIVHLKVDFLQDGL